MNFNFFKKKTDVYLADFCADFYEKNIFPAKKEGVDNTTIFFDGVKKSVEEVDQRFVSISSRNLIDEMTIIRLEVFAIAWTHQFGEKLAIQNGIFTKDYLNKKNQHSVWENSEPYNKAVAQSCIYGKNTNSPVDMRQIGFINSKKVSLFKEYTDKGFDSVCVARSINRYYTETAWEQGVTAGLLTLALCSRLNCEINNEAMFRFTAVIRGFYDGIKQNLIDIKIKNL